MNTITIAGGGLAGLGLGLALARRGVPVELHEAGAYPRHRVCGEFLCGLDRGVAEDLGVAPFLEDAERLRTCVWFAGGRPFLRRALPEVALGMSRYRLDARLAAAAAGAGVALRAGSACEPGAAEGRVWAAGKSARAGGRWVGMKCHVAGFDAEADLEMHVGNGGYVGLSRVEDGRANVCGLFRRGAGSAGGPGLAGMRRWMEGTGLEALASRLGRGAEVAGSHAAVAGFRFGRVRGGREELRIGDAHALIPPFTGNGMSMALESAWEALGPLEAYARGRMAWGECRVRIHRALRRRFRRRLAWAAALHPLALNLAAAGGLAKWERWVPFAFFFWRLRSA